jgi:hypothetical protein
MAGNISKNRRLRARYREAKRLEYQERTGLEVSPEDWAKRYEPKPPRFRGHPISEERYREMVEEQGGRCGICGTVPDVLMIDHCHETGAVRGLVCGHCNFVLGHAKDRVWVLRSAADYLDRHASRISPPGA